MQVPGQTTTFYSIHRQRGSLCNRCSSHDVWPSSHDKMWQHSGPTGGQTCHHLTVWGYTSPYGIKWMWWFWLSVIFQVLCCMVPFHVVETEVYWTRPLSCHYKPPFGSASPHLPYFFAVVPVFRHTAASRFSSSLNWLVAKICYLDAICCIVRCMILHLHMPAVDAYHNHMTVFDSHW